MIGELVRVERDPLGTALAAAAAVSDTVLTVEWVNDFDELGGTLRLDGDTDLAYDSTDPDTDTITLSAPLADAWDAETSVAPVNPDGTEGVDWLAWVLLDEDGEEIPATIPADQLDYFREGEEQAGLGVQVDVVDGEYLVLGVVGSAPTLSLANADPTTLPDKVPTEAPTETITIKGVVGDATGLTAVAAGTPAQTTYLEWYLDGVLKETTTSLVYRFTTDAAGDPLVADTDYSITVKPVNSVGDGTLSAAVTGRLNPDVTSETVLGYVAAGFVLAGAIQVGAMTITAPTDDDPGGILIPLTNGGTIHFPADGSDAVITAILRARSLVVDDNLTLNGDLNHIFGTLFLSAGVNAPSTKPSASTSWDHAAAYLESDVTLSGPSGLYDNSTAWVFTDVTGGNGYVHSVDKTTGVSTLLKTFGGGISKGGGAVKIGTDWYVLCYEASTNWIVRKYNSSWVLQSTWIRSGSLTYNEMALATDGTYLYTVHRNASTNVVVTRYNPDGTGGTTLFTSSDTVSSGVSGLYVGNADFGALRYVVSAFWDGPRVYNSSGAPQTTQHWTGAAGGVTIYGLAWDGTRFHSVGLPTGAFRVYHYSQVVTATSRSITYTWYDNDGTTHESTPSPTLTYTQPARQWLKVTTDTPADTGGADDPNAVRIYVANQRQADLATGATSAVYDVPATGGAAAPTSNGFASVSSPGILKSQTEDTIGPLIELYGSGEGRTGWNLWDETGALMGAVGLRSTTTDQSIATSTFTKVNLTGTADHNQYVPVAASVITVPYTGLYQISASLSWANTSSTNRRITDVEYYTGTDPGVGSGTRIGRDETGGSLNPILRHRVVTDVYLPFDAQVRLIVWQNSGGSVSIDNAVPAQLNLRRVG